MEGAYGVVSDGVDDRAASCFQRKNRSGPSCPRTLCLHQTPQGRTVMNDKNKSTTNDKKVAKEQDDYLQEALEETFPASDPISPGHVETKHENEKTKPKS